MIRTNMSFSFCSNYYWSFSIRKKYFYSRRISFRSAHLPLLDLISYHCSESRAKFNIFLLVQIYKLWSPVTAHYSSWSVRNPKQHIWMTYMKKSMDRTNYRRESGQHGMAVCECVYATTRITSAHLWAHNGNLSNEHIQRESKWTDSKRENNDSSHRQAVKRHLEWPEKKKKKMGTKNQLEWNAVRGDDNYWLLR